MADPFSIIMGVVGIGSQIVGSIKQGEAAQSAAQANSQKDTQNAQIALDKAKEDERSFRVSTRNALGSMRAQYGASGIAAEGSSAADVIGDSAAKAELDALKIRHGGEIQAMGYKSDASLDQARANAYGTSGYLSALGSLGTGLARMKKDF